MCDVDDICLAFRPYVETIYSDLKLGLCKCKIDIERVGNAKGGNSQFRLLLPYCSKKLKWEIIFDSSVPWFAPDFRFDDDSFLSHLDEGILEQYLPSLSKWNPSDLRCLNNVLSELINLYKKHQVKKLNDDGNSRASFEYNALLANALTTEEDVEVWVGNHTVEFLIKLKVDTSRLPEIYDNNGSDENPGIDSALLLVRYPNSTNAELILSPFLTKVLGNMTLPPMHQNGVLMDYVPLVTDIFNRKVQDLLNTDKLKRELLAQIIVKYEGAILEHDANSAALLFEMNDFHFILQIDIGLQFPEKPPVLTIRSVYHCSLTYPFRKPKYKVLPSCPYNNFEGYIAQQVEIFKMECKGSTLTQPLLDIDN